MKNQKNMKKTLAIVLCLAVVLTGFYIPENMTVQAAEMQNVTRQEGGNSSENTASVETLESLGFDLPESYDTDGLNPGNHSLNSMEEVVVGRHTAGQTNVSIYDYDTNSNVQKLNSNAIINSHTVDNTIDGTTEGTTSGPTVRSISTSFDSDGDGKKESTAYLYLDNKDGYGGNICLKVEKIGEDFKRDIVLFGPIGASIKTKKAIPLYSFRGIIDITAGDFDGDGADELAVYAPNNADTVETTTQPYQPNCLEIRIFDFYSYEDGEYEILRAAQRINLAAGTTEWTWSSDGGTKQYYSIPYVSLTADDVNGDGVDDLMAVTSFSYMFRGFQNGIGKGYTWEKVLNPDTCFASILDVYEGSRTEDGRTSFTQTVTKKPLIGKGDDGAYVLRNATAIVADVTGTGSGEIVFGGNYTEITYDSSTTTNTIVTATRKETMNGKYYLGVVLGYTSYENLKNDTTAAASLKYNWIQNDGNGDKVCQESREISNEPVSLIGFKAFGSALPDALFLEGQVFAYGDESKIEWFYDFPRIDESSGNQDRWLTDAVVANVTNSAIGEETVYVPYYIRRNDGVITSRIISVWGNAFSGDYTSYETDKLGEGVTYSVFMLDVDQDSSFIRYTEGNVDVYYGDVEILSVLQAAPTWKELGGYGENGETSWAKTTGSGSSQSNDVTLSAGAIIGFEQEVSILGLFKVGGMEFETTIVGSVGYTGETSVSKEYTAAYNTDGTDDAVVIFTVPYVRYNCEMFIPTYTVPTEAEYNAKNAFLTELEANIEKYLDLSAAVTGGAYSKPNDGFNNGYTTNVTADNYEKQVAVYQNYVEWLETAEATISELGGGGEYTWGQEIPGGWEPYDYCIPQTPILTTVNVETYDAIMEQNGKQTIYGNIFSEDYRAGDPSTYAHNTSELKAAANEDVLAGKTNSGENADTDGFITSTAVSASASAPSQSIAVTKENANGVTYGAAVEMSAVTNAGGIQVGAVTSVEYGGSNVWTTTEGCEFSGCVPNLPSGSSNAYSYSWKMVSYMSTLNGQKVPVVGYLTKMQQTPPPSVPEDLIAIALSSDNIGIQWSQGEREADYFELYRVTYTNNKQYEDKIAEVSENENGVYSFVDDGAGEGLDPSTTYYYAVKAYYDGDKNNGSTFSEIAAATTLAEGAEVKAVVEGMDSNTAYLAGREMVLTAVVDSTIDYAIRSCEWECNKGNGWVAADGTNDETTYKFRLSTLKNGWQYRCKLEVRLGNKINGFVYEMYSDPVVQQARRIGTFLNMSAAKSEGAADASTGYGPANGDSLEFTVQVVPEAETDTSGTVTFIVTRHENETISKLVTNTAYSTRTSSGNEARYEAAVDENGKASIRIPFTEAGRYTISAEYGGNDDCEGSETTEAFGYIAYGEDEKETLFDFSGAEVSLKENDFVYTGSQICPEVKVTWNQSVLVKDVDYVVSYGVNTTVGTDAGTITVTPIGNFEGQQAKSVSFDIAKREAEISVSKTEYTVTMGDKPFALGATTDAGAELVYTGYDSKIVNVDADGLVTIVGVGTTNITIALKDMKNYTVTTKTVEVKVLPRETGLQVTKTKTTYTAGEVLSVKDLTVTLLYEDGTKKTITGYTTDADKINMNTPGDKSLTVSYNGLSAKIVIKVLPRETGLQVTKTKTTYTAGEILNVNDLTVTLLHEDGTKKNITGFTTDADKINMDAAGDKVLTVSYNGLSAKITIKVNPHTVTFDANGGTNLSKNTITISIHNAQIGTLPTVSRKGYTFKGWYTAKTGGTQVIVTTRVTRSMTVYAQWDKEAVTAPGKANTPTLKSKKIGQITVSYKKVSGAKGYEIKYSTNKKFTKSATKTAVVTGKSKTLTKLSAGKTYYVKVRAYKVDKAGKKVYGAYSSVKNITLKPAKANTPVLKSKKKGQLTVSFKKLSNVKGYEITYSTSKKFTKSTTKTTTVSKTSKTLTGLKKGKTYYVKIRAYSLNASGKKVYGAYSKVKNIKVKK